MLNMSEMSTIRPVSHGLMHVELGLWTLATAKPTNLGSTGL